jgi:hypothetical protein
MKIKKGFVVKEIAGQNVVIALGAASKVFNGIIKLNDSARFIWDMLTEGKEKEEIIAALSEEYADVDRELLEKDFDTFIEALKGAKILE